MKKFLLSLLTLVLASPVFAASPETIDFTSGYSNQQALSTVTQGDVTLTFDKADGSSAPAWYNTGTAARLYAKNELTIEAGGNTITKVVLTFSGTSYTMLVSGYTIDGYTESGTTGTWSGTGTSVTLKRGGTSGHARVQYVEVTYSTGGGPVVETVATPVISPASCNFSDDFDATITCSTADASIFYSLDGSEPSIAYSGAISIDAGASVTLKAKATKSGWNDSAVTEAVYTYVAPAPAGAHYELVAFDDILASDLVVVYDKKTGRAMTNDKGTGAAPAAKALSLGSDGTPAVADVTDDIKWNVDGGVLYPAGQTATWLYATATNNGVRVGTNTANEFSYVEVTNFKGLQHNGTSRYIGVYSNTDWRCYTTVNNNITGTETVFFRYVGTPAPEAVATPTISPNGGSDLLEAQTVSLSCETSGASIYYTLDGSTPTAASTLYTAPFQVSTDTTVKAIGIKADLANSAVAEATFQFRVAATSITDLYTKTGLDGSTQIYVNFPLTVTAPTKGKNTFVQDGQGGYSLIYFNNNTVYAAGDVIPAGWYAKATTYQGLNEIVPLEATPAASGSATVDYPVTAVSAITVENQCKPATVNDVVIADIPTSNTITATVGGTTFSIYNISSTAYGDIEPGGYNVKGVITLYNGAPQLNVFEFEAIPVPDVYILGNINENNNAWAPNVGYQMVYDAGGAMYTATIHAPAAGASFSFATALGTSSDWNTLNGRDVRWGHGGTDYTLTAEDMQGQNAIACSKYDYTTGSYVIPEGEYNLILSFDGDGLNAYLFVEKVEAPKDVYILGTVNTTAANWVPYEGVLMTRDEDTGLYSAEVYAEAGDRINFAHFLGSTWAEVNVPGNRFSVPNQNYMVNDTSRGIQMAYSTDPYSFEFGTQGKWEVVVNLDNEGEMTADFNKLEFEAPTFSVASCEFHEAFDLTITGPEGSTLTYSVDGGANVQVASNTVTINIPAADTYVDAYATLYGVDSEVGEEIYVYSEPVIVPDGEYAKVLAADQPLKAGKYLIVCEIDLSAAAGAPIRDASVANPVFNGGAETLDASQNYVITPRSGDIINIDPNDDIYYVNIAPVAGETDTYTIQAANGKYIGRSANSNGMDVSDDPVNNTITIDSEGNANIVGAGGAYFRYNSNSGQERFRYFKSSTYTAQQPVQLYFNGETTGVDSVATNSEVVSTAYYNLQGVRLTEPAKGQIAIRVSTLANGQIRASKVVVR